MSNPDTIMIDNTKYVRASEAGEPSPMQIVIADRGWVFIGRTSNDDYGTTITCAKCIRIWGTDSEKPGLGYLALHGPTSKTKLDDVGTVRIPPHAVVATIDTESSKWA